MGKFVFFFLMALSSAVSASDFSGGSEEFAPEPGLGYDEAAIQQRIQDEMRVFCAGDLCRIVSSDGSGASWTVGIQVGYGQAGAQAGGDTFYIGGTPATSASPFASVTVTYNHRTCHSTLKVTPAVYRMINTYLYNMVNADGSVRRSFSPADQTALLFYTTMLNKVEACKEGR